MIPLHLQSVYERAEFLQRNCFETADELLGAAGLTTDEAGRRRLARAVSAAMQRASLALERLDLGEGSELLSLGSASATTNTANKSVGLDKLVEDWARERSPAKKTLYEWTRVVQELKRYLGHDDAARIGMDHGRRWLDGDVTRPRNGKSKDWTKAMVSLPHSMAQFSVISLWSAPIRNMEFWRCVRIVPALCRIFLLARGFAFSQITLVQRVLNIPNIMSAKPHLIQLALPVLWRV